LTQQHDSKIRVLVFDENIFGGLHDLKITEPAAAKIQTSSIYERNIVKRNISRTATAANLWTSEPSILKRAGIK
jgi:hypothetical protein